MTAPEIRDRRQKARSSRLHWQMAAALGNRTARLLLARAKLLPLLARRPENAYPYAPMEMWSLYRDIRRRRPKVVMEFGVGCSTLVIAAALHENGAGRLITVDASEAWVSACRDALPDSLLPLIDFHCLPLEIVPGESAHRYTDLPRVPLDYLFIDGPASAHVPDWQGPAVSCDPVLDMTFNAGARITVEGRESTVAYLETHLRDRCRIRAHPPLIWTTFDFA